MLSLFLTCSYRQQHATLDQGRPAVAIMDQAGLEPLASARSLPSRGKEPMDFDMSTGPAPSKTPQQCVQTLDHHPPASDDMIIAQEHSNPLISLPSYSMYCRIVTWKSSVLTALSYQARVNLVDNNITRIVKLELMTALRGLDNGNTLHDENDDQGPIEIRGVSTLLSPKAPLIPDDTSS